MKTIKERREELLDDLQYQNSEERNADDVLKYVGLYHMAIKQHIKTIGDELSYLKELEENK